MDPIIPDADGQAQQVKQLNAAQTDAESGSNYAEQAGLTGPAASKPAKPQTASWGALVKDHPVLSQHLVDPQFANAAKDDIPQLSKIERLFGGWDEMMWKSKLELESDSRNQRLAAIGRAQRDGSATPEMLKEGDEIEKQAASVKEPNVGFVPGIVPSVVGVIPGLSRALPTAAAYGIAGAAGGLLLGKNPKLALAAGGAMAGAGFTVGMAMDTARTEQGLAYRQYVKAGVDPKTAGVAADLVALANGGIQAIPVQKVFNLVPGISNLLAGKKTRDLVSALITSNTGRAALQRFALRAGESGLLMALVGGGQELVRELGALGAGADDKLHGGRIWDAATGGLQQGLGFGLGHSIAPFIGDYREAKIGEARGEMYRAIANESKNSKLREQMPEAFKNYVNAVIAEHGNVEEAKAPAEKLTSLLQKEGVTDEQLQERMPDVAKQLKNAGPKDEIVIPMGDLATHLAPLKSFEEFSQDLRVGDDALTPRESKKIGELADKFEKEQPAAKEGAEPEPGRKVFDDVYDQLTQAGQDPNVARHDAALWAAFATSRGERLGMDPFEYYKSRVVKIGTEFPERTDTTLGQIDPTNPAFKKWFGESKIVDEEGKPRTVYHGTTHEFNTFSNERSNPESHYGRAHYFTTEPKDASGNYGGIGPDLTSRIDLRAEQIFDEADPNNYKLQHGTQEYEDAMHVAREQAAKELAGDAHSILPVHLRIENPVVIEKDVGTYFSPDELNGKRLLKSLQKVGEKYGVDLSELSTLVYDGTNAYDFEQAMRKSETIAYAEDDQGKLISNEIIRDVWKEAKFDGIDMNANQAFGLERQYGKPMEGIDENTRHYVVFDPKQIKSVFNRGTFSRRSANILEQPAYHGTPHHFEKFTLDHIGSGEGAQVYGWGLYFAESKGVADYYKEQLARPELQVEPKEVRARFEEQLLAKIQEVQDEADGKLSANDKSRIETYKNKIDELYSKFTDEYIQDNLDLVKDFAERWEIDTSDTITDAKGHVYEVDLPEKQDLLDYDKPIDRQPPSVLKKLEDFGVLPKGFSETVKRVHEINRELEKIAERPSAEHENNPELKSRYDELIKERSKILEDHDLKGGVKLPNGERASWGPGTNRGGQHLYAALAQTMIHPKTGEKLPGGGDKSASKLLLEAGIPGLKYLDQNSRNKSGIQFWGEKAIDEDGTPFRTPGGQRYEDFFADQIQKEVRNGGEIEDALSDQVQRVRDEVEFFKKQYEKIPKFDRTSQGAESLASQVASSKTLLKWAESLKPEDFEWQEGSHNFVIWDETAIQTLNVLEQRGGAAGTEGYRGKISFDDVRSYFNITLTGKANLSTFLHESGHAFFEFMRKDAESGHAQSAEDFGKLLEWMGIKPGEQPSTEQLEQFARGFEGYLMEGKAPAPGLRGLFRTFSSWLKQVYKGMKSLGVNLTDDVRGVMDRMLASDKEIEKAKEGLGLEPMKKPEGMSDAEYKAYTEKFGKAMEAGRNELEELALKEFRKTIGEERAKTQADVDAATKVDPAHNAYETLRTGKRLDGGEVPPEIAGKKLDREAVAEAGHKGIKWASITEEGGLDPDVAAPLLGYADGPALLAALEARRSRTKEIKEETERRMMDKYPNADIAKMSEQAVTALHLKDDVGNVLWLEAKAIGKQIGADDPRTARAVVKEIARRRVSEMTALEMQPGRFARGEERAAGEWADAMKGKDFEEAHRAKLDQILNHEMFKAVSEAKDEIDSIRSYLDGFNELPNRRRLGKAGQSYLNAIDAIISDIELKRQTNKTLARRASLESYLAEMENEDGALITIPAELRSEAALKNYKQMTLDDLRTVHDAVANIETMARLKNKLFDGRERRNFHETAVRLAENVKANLGDSFAEKPGAPQNAGWLDKKKEMLRKSVAEMKKIEFLARAMDGGATAGWVHSILFQPFATADAKKLEWTKKVTETLLKPLREMSLKERAQFDKTVDFLGTPMKMRDVIAVALNMGNNGNKKKLLDGYAYRGWTEEKVIGRLGELLTDKHLDIVDHFWKTIGSLWPEIKALSERTTGVAPPKVEAAKLTIRGRELEGGYYPIVYDRDRSYKAEQFAQKKGDLFENNFLKPGVSKGFTEARTQFAAPILLSLNVIPSHMNEVIHYLTHLEPIRAVDRLMAHAEVRKAVTEAMGKETYNLFRPWLQAIAHDGVVSNNTTTIDNVLRHLRVGASVTRLGFRLSNSIMQGFNILSSVKELGGFVGGSKYLTLGMKAWMKDFDSFIDPFKAVHEQSPEIRGKTEKYEHNLIGNFDHFTSAFSEFGHYKERLGHFAMSFMTLAWKSVETMTWYAAREKAFDENHPHPNEYADSVVRLSQMGEGMKDKAAIMRGGEGTKIFTYMYSWYSTIFNQLTETQPQARGSWAKAGELASRYWWMVLAPTVMMSLARGKHPKHDDGETGTEAGYLAGEVALETAKAYLGPIGGITADTMLSGHDAKFAPWISTVLRGLVVRGKMAAGHPLTDKEKKDLFESTGIMSHLPAGAMYNAMKYVSAVQDGKLEEPVRDLLFRSPGDWK